MKKYIKPSCTLLFLLTSCFSNGTSSNILQHKQKDIGSYFLTGDIEKLKEHKRELILNWKDKDGTPAIIKAIILENKVLLKYLLEIGADPNTRFCDMPALFYALELKDNSILIELLNNHLIFKGADPDIKYGEMPALIRAIELGNISKIKVLAAINADLTVSYRERSALQRAIEANRPDIVEVIFDNIKELREIAMIYNILIKTNNKRMLKNFLAFNIKYSLVTGNYSYLRKILYSKLVSPNSKYQGASMLMFCIAMKNVEALNIFLTAGADSNRYHKDKPPLYWIASEYIKEGCKDKFDFNIIKLLLKFGANPNVQIINKPLLFAAIETEDELLLELLLKSKIDKFCTYGGMDPLYYAFYIRSIAPITMLLHEDIKLLGKAINLAIIFNEPKAIAEISKIFGIDCKKEKMPFIIHATKLYRLEVLNALLSAGYDPNEIDSEEKTALYYAVSAESLDMTELLLAHNALPYVSDSQKNFHILTLLNKRVKADFYKEATALFKKYIKTKAQ